MKNETFYDQFKTTLEKAFNQVCRNNHKSSCIDLFREHLLTLVKRDDTDYSTGGHFVEMMSTRFKLVGSNAWRDGIDRTSLLTNFVYDIATRSHQLKIFNVADGLAKYLDLSDYKDIPGSMFRLPYDNIVFRIPPGILKDTYVNNDGVVYDYTDIYVSQYPEVTPEISDECLQSGFVPDNSHVPDNHTNIRLFKVWLHGNKNGMDMLKYHWMPVIDGMNIKELRDTEFVKSAAFKNGVKDLMRTNQMDEQAASDMLLDNHKLFESVLMYVVKIVMYLNSQNAEMIKTSSIVMNSRTRYSVLKRDEYAIGRNIVVDKRISSAYADYVSSDRKMACPKWLVRGHMRRYNDVKTIWIEPYYKGESRNDDSIIEINKDYIVKG